MVLSSSDSCDSCDLCIEEEYILHALFLQPSLIMHLSSSLIVHQIFAWCC